MKVAMENVILIVCPQGFAPLTSQRHTTQMLGVMICFSFYLFFIFFCFLHFHISYFSGFADGLFDEVIMPVDWEGKVTFWELRKIIESCVTTTVQYDIGLMWQVLIYPMAICFSSLFHEGAYWITSKWCLWSKRLLHHGVAAAHSSVIKTR